MCEPLVVSFATNDRYRYWGERLIEQCTRLGIEHHVEFLEPWCSNKRQACLYRPEWMLGVMERANRPLVWFDADGDILEPFGIPDEPAGFVDNPWKHRWPQNPVAAAVFMVRPQGVELLHAWKEQCDRWRPGEYGSHMRLCSVRNVVENGDMTPFVRGKVLIRVGAGRKEKYL